ncbi:NAD(P)-dependent alcohol dehydrogenase [Plantactinospora sp. KLBMP9567]|uniref:NAD(P)-dependent alcohol dehydrogenase n=1 Tax=Plantactinospora sp. KLBMP9567 TaxID=3085900 RepID=UPI002981B632|nr:NAD(P)-dependent alcohol dehydrogenase [Plantactinospora sp. KLBMP9567]MDW5326735.1 NAD(P)-dependent alcohol dehydrogenase [Plantactinospora sp. KLBMP9567]
MQIRAAVAPGPGQPFSIEDLELNEPRDDEVLVRIVATGICQTDAHVRNGRTPAPLPIVLGHEGAGIVERVGPAVTELRPGDHVVLSYQSCGHCPQCLAGHPAYCTKALPANFSGTRLDGSRGLRRKSDEAGEVFGHFFGQSSFATHALTTQRNTVKVDQDLPLELLSPLGCSLQTGAGAVLNSFAVPAGETIAIFGVGAVGFGALMAARLAGAATITAVDVNTQRLALAQELGATHTVDATQADVAEAIKDISSGGVGYVLDTTGRSDMLDHAVTALRPLGRVGLVAGGVDNTVPAAKLAFGKTVTGIVQGDAIPQVFIPRLTGFHRSGRFPIERLVRFYDFDDIETAFAAAASGEVIKPVLRIADSAAHSRG